MTGIIGAATAQDGSSEYNGYAFMAQQLINKIWTMRIVLVKAHTPGVGLLPGTVDVQPMVNQIDGIGNSVPHGIINNIPVWMLQGGGSAAIIPPAEGDIGICIFADRDISSVKSTGQVANPGSFRVHDPADGIYLGGTLNGAPTQYIQLLPNNGGINVVTSGAYTIQAGSISMTAAGDIAINAAQTNIDGGLTSNNVDVSSTHYHGEVQIGSSNTSTPL